MLFESFLFHYMPSHMLYSEVLEDFNSGYIKAFTKPTSLFFDIIIIGPSTRLHVWNPYDARKYCFCYFELFVSVMKVI